MNKNQRTTKTRDASRRPDPPLLDGMPDDPHQPTAGDLVEAWATGYSTAHGGKQPPRAAVKRVAGTARELARSLTTLDDWRDAHRAAHAAGTRARWDLVSEMTDSGRPVMGNGRQAYHAQWLAEQTSASLAACGLDHDTDTADAGTDTRTIWEIATDALAASPRAARDPRNPRRTAPGSQPRTS